MSFQEKKSRDPEKVLRKCLGLAVLFALRVQRGLDRFGQILCLASAPKMQEQDSRFFMRHVAVNSHDVDT
jgi:hypothetical protein